MSDFDGKKPHPDAKLAPIPTPEGFMSTAEMLRKVRESSGQFRAETLRLVADPRSSASCARSSATRSTTCSTTTAFPDLPNDWRARLTA
jgi:hypothetical protein